MSTAATSPCHTLPNEFMFEGMPMNEQQSPNRTLQLLLEGEGPQYEVMVATYTRTGTARLLETVWLLLHDLDFDTARSVDITQRHIFLDTCDPKFESHYGGNVKLSPSSNRLAKTHFDYHVMKKHVGRGAKFVVGLRNPKDTLVSLYHFYCTNKLYGLFQGTFQQYFELIKEKHVPWGDFFEFCLSWWQERHRDNILFVSYEDLTENPVEEIQKMAKFLGKAVSDEQIAAIVRWTAFGNMKQEESLNYNVVTGGIFVKEDAYMRKGKIGDWKNRFTEEQSRYIDEEYVKRCIPVGLTFRFE